MIKNKTLGKYDIKHNNIGNDGKYFWVFDFIKIGINFFIEILPELAHHVYEIEISERIDKEVLAEFREKLTANKPKKSKKKKGGKKKKKKWNLFS